MITRTRQRVRSILSAKARSAVRPSSERFASDAGVEKSSAADLVGDYRADGEMLNIGATLRGTFK